MRFLLNDAEILSLAFKFLIRIPRENNATTVADKSKIDEQLELLMKHFFKMEKSFKRMKESCKKIASLTTEDVSLMTSPVKNYYKSRATDGFTFEDYVHEVEESHELLQVADSESNTSNSQNSSRANLSQADQLATIGLQDEFEPANEQE